MSFWLAFGRWSHDIDADDPAGGGYIPEGSILRTSASPRQNMWEINLPEDFNKSVKKVAKTLDAIAYM